MHGRRTEIRPVLVPQVVPRHPGRVQRIRHSKSRRLSRRTRADPLCAPGSVGTSDVAAPGRCAHHPGITPGRVIRGDRDGSPMRGRRSRGRPMRACKRVDSHRGRGARGHLVRRRSAWLSARLPGRVRRWHPGSSRTHGQPMPDSQASAHPCGGRPPLHLSSTAKANAISLTVGPASLRVSPATLRVSPPRVLSAPQLARICPSGLNATLREA